MFYVVFKIFFDVFFIFCCFLIHFKIVFVFFDVTCFIRVKSLE